jgi:hypothetical protein
MDGIYHATLVCGRLAEFDRAWLDGGLMDHANRAGIERSASDVLARFRGGVDVIDRHGKLSERGRHLLDRCSRALAVAA